MYNRMIILACP